MFLEIPFPMFQELIAPIEKLIVEEKMLGKIFEERY
jgi:hypothetical protein